MEIKEYIHLVIIMGELHEDEDLIRYELPNRLTSIIYKKRKNTKRKRYILHNENHIILPSNKISEEYKSCTNPIDYNYEELHVYMEVNTGSINEKKNQQGISHLCEHVSYMGSKNRKNIIDKNIRTNAYTDFHHVVFYISISLNNEIYKENSFSNFAHDGFIKNINEEEIENFDIYSVDEFNYKHTILSQCIETMIEVLKGETQFNKERIIKEKKAIFSEYSIINTVEYKMNSDIIKTLHKENRLSHRLPIGKLELLKRYDEKDIKQYFDLFFRPENVNLFVYGDINVDIAQKLINKKFENIKGKDLTRDETAYLNILNENTLKSRNKNLPAVVHAFGSNSSKGYEANGYSPERNDDSCTSVVDERNNEYIDDNIIDSEKLKELKKKNQNEIMSELQFRSYLEDKYAVNLEEEKTLNRRDIKNITTDVRIFKYSLNNVNINILLKEEIKSITTLEDYKISIMKDIIFYCLSFRFNIHRNDLFNSIDINEYTNINEGATIRTIEIKTTIKSFEKTINAFYTFIKSLRMYGLSNDELRNYKINEIECDEEEEANKHGTTKNMKLIHPEKNEDEEYILDTKINETYTDEIQKIIDYNSCKHVYINEKREKKIKKKIFDNLKIEEINVYAKQYFEYIFNIFSEGTNFKPNCIIIHVPYNHFDTYNKKDIKKLFFDNIYSKEQIPNLSLNIQSKLLSPQYIYENITKKLRIAKYVQPRTTSTKISVFNYILNKINKIKKDYEHICPLQNLNTVPNFALFKICYNVEIDKNHIEETNTEVQKKNDVKWDYLKKEETYHMYEMHEMCKQNGKDTKEQSVKQGNYEKMQSVQDKNIKDNGNILNLKKYILSNKGQKQVENYELMNGIKVNLFKTNIDKKYIYLRLIIPHMDILKTKKYNVFLLLFSVICLFEGGEIENVGREHVEIHCSNRSINIYIDLNDEYFFIDICTYNKYENINSAFSILNNILLQTKVEQSALLRVVDKLKKDFFEYKNNLQVMLNCLIKPRSFLLGQTISYLSDGAIGYQNFNLKETENISLETVQHKLRELFRDLSLFEITIVGDISPFIHYYILHFLGTLQGGKKINTEKGISTDTREHIRTNATIDVETDENFTSKNYRTSNCITLPISSDEENDLRYEYNLLCPLKNFEAKSKEITYVYLNEKEEHAVFLLIGKSANYFGFLSNGIHISFYLLQFLKKMLFQFPQTNGKKEEEKKALTTEFDKIKGHLNIKQYTEENLNEFFKKRRKLYTNPLFFNVVSYIIQYILNSKFFHYLREKKELTYDSSFEFLNYEKYFTGFFTLLVQTNPKDLQLIKKEVLSCFEDFTKNFYNFSDYLIENAKLSYLNKKNKDLKYFVDKISGMQLKDFPLKYRNKFLLKDNLILNKIEKIDILLVLYVLFNQTQSYHISYGISSPEDVWKVMYKNINKI
ncbi:metalloendopeptidase [Plasmodium malariae]|uniref:Metalloendopeptidase n=1 Tax=Plasmodium malariae TaxID=5858 RepID=A0A1A8WB64_PLAMA|nr:metalloendopeptidase [Plasmodium malariae]